MATPETHSVELDPLTPSFDGDQNAVESEEHQIVEADTRELPPYSFDSDDKTLVGMGTSGSAGSRTPRHFDSSDRTLVGIGPAERAKRAKLAELARHSQQAESAPEGVPMPHSEPPGPFVASDDDEDALDRLPMQKAEPWLLALSAVLVAAAAVALLRGVVPHTTAPRLHSATTVAPLPHDQRDSHALRAIRDSRWHFGRDFRGRDPHRAGARSSAARAPASNRAAHESSPSSRLGASPRSRPAKSRSEPSTSPRIHPRPGPRWSPTRQGAARHSTRFWSPHRAVRPSGARQNVCHRERESRTDDQRFR